MTMALSRSLRLAAAGLAVALVAVACGGNGGDGGTGTGEAELTGSITVSGSSTVEPITTRNAEKFAAEHPEVEISVDGPGTSDGFELFCNGETDISDASRPIDAEEEVPNCEKNGVEFVELKVAIDGLSVITSPENGAIDCLGFHDLYALLGPESEGFTSWSDADELAQEVGATHAPYPDVPLDVTAPGEESGTFDSFSEIVMEDIAYEERKISEDDPVIRPDYQASGNDNVIIEGISGSPMSLGWVGYAFVQQNAGAVKALAIEDENGECIEPTPETISGGAYPIARDLYIYVNTDSLGENSAVEAFVDYYMSDEGLASVAEVGYVDLAEDDVAASRQVWEDLETGTRGA
ncbi:MAG: phosphate ABC transporter substrate-binding protein PstS family protein [Actinomycetota bacterium]